MNTVMWGGVFRGYFTLKEKELVDLEFILDNRISATRRMMQ